MNIKDIVSKTVLFIVIVGFIIGFQSVFGTKNSLIGVSTITAMLMLLERDLTAQLISQTFKLIGFNLFIGIAAYLAGLNIWLGIPINFAAMFIISYSLMYNLKNPLFLPFSLQYLFILVTPVPLTEMPLRLSSLVAGAIAIMLMQLLANKNKISKSGNKQLSEMCAVIRDKVTKLKTNEDCHKVDATLFGTFNSLRNMIYDKRKYQYYLGEEARIKLNLSAGFEKINVQLNQASKEDLQQEIVVDLEQFLTLLADCFINMEKINDVKDAFSRIFSKYEQKTIDSLFTLRMLNNLNFIKDQLMELKNLDKEQYSIVRQMEQIPKKYRKVNVGKNVKHTNSIKLSYAMRMGVGVSIAAFITEAFHLSEGRWIIFTILALVVPIYEHTHKKMRDRIFATIVGSVIVFALFTIFTGATERIILLMLAGYVNNFVKPYRYSTILITLSAIGSAAIATNATAILTVHRIYMVVIGTVLALLINKFVYPYKLEDANRDLVTMYQDAINEMLKEVSAKLNGDGSKYVMKNLFIVTTMIENKVKLNNQDLADHPNAMLLPEQRLLVCTIYELYMWIERYGITEENSALIKRYIEKLDTEWDRKETIKEIESHLVNTTNMNDRLVYSVVSDIIKQLNEPVKQVV